MKSHTKIFLLTILNMWRLKKYIKTYNVNPLYLIFRYVNGYFEGINGNKYLALVPNNESKQKI